MSETKKRITWIDMAKGYGIIFVIIGHIGLGPISDWIYTFHIPLFFFLSGYVFSNKNSFGEFFKKKIKSMIIPYFSLGVVVVAFKELIYYRTGDCTTFGYIKVVLDLFIQERMSTLWFLACLFLINIIFYFMLKWIKNKTLMAIAIAVITVAGLVYYRLGGQPLPWNLDVCMTAISFFYVGYAIKQYGDKLRDFASKTSTSVILFLACGAANLVFGYLSYRISGSVLNMFDSVYGFEPFTYISAFAGIACVVIISKWFVIKPVKYIGENSLLYFAWHQTVFMTISVDLLTLANIVATDESGMKKLLIYKAIEFVLVMIMCTIANLIVTKTKLKFIVGR